MNTTTPAFHWFLPTGGDDRTIGALTHGAHLPDATAEIRSSRHGCGSDRGNDGLRLVRVRKSGDTLSECEVRTVEGPSFKVD
jgi:hypothetical protein